MALTVERYLSLCVPFMRYRYNLRPIHYILSVLIFSTAYNSPRFFEWETWTDVYDRPCVISYYGKGTSINDVMLLRSQYMCDNSA